MPSPVHRHSSPARDLIVQGSNCPILFQQCYCSPHPLSELSDSDSDNVSLVPFNHCPNCPIRARTSFHLFPSTTVRTVRFGLGQRFTCSPQPLSELSDSGSDNVSLVLLNHCPNCPTAIFSIALPGYRRTADIILTFTGTVNWKLRTIQIYYLR